MKPIPDHSPWPFVLPFVAFMAIGILEPRFPAADESGLTPSAAVARQPLREGDLTAQQANDMYFAKQRSRVVIQYCLTYAIKTLVTCGLLCWFAKIYLGQFTLTATAGSVVTGIVGVVVWIGLCQIGIEASVIKRFGAAAETVRSQFNPFDQISIPAVLAAFLALRFFGLVIVVPLCEELFLRGFLMRYIQSPQWWTVSLSRMSMRALLVAPLYGALTHPGEAVAAVVWFSLVTWLVNKTGNFWDAVIAHAVTNLLLGLYVCGFAQWQLW